MKTRLDIYKTHFDCKDDGEAVLKAAEMAFFPAGLHNDALLRKLEDGSITNQKPSHNLFEAWGIQAEMTRDEIIACLSRIDVTELSGEQKEIIDSAIRFTVQSIDY